MRKGSKLSSKPSSPVFRADVSRHPSHRHDSWQCAGGSRLRREGETWIMGPMRGWRFRLLQVGCGMWGVGCGREARAYIVFETETRGRLSDQPDAPRLTDSMFGSTIFAYGSVFMRSPRKISSLPQTLCRHRVGYRQRYILPAGLSSYPGPCCYLGRVHFSYVPGHHAGAGHRSSVLVHPIRRVR